MQPSTGLTELLCVRPSGERINVTVAIGHPYPTSGGEWACPVEMSGLHGRLVDIRGIDSLQALCLAVNIVRELLASFRADGGRILDSKTGEDFLFDTYFDPGSRK
jgi:uncharacterized protein DUF6968